MFGEKPQAGQANAKSHASRTTKSTSKMFSQLSANKCPHALHASRAAPESSTLTHRYAQATEPHEEAGVAGIR